MCVLLFRVLLVYLQVIVSSHAIDMLHDSGKLMLVGHPCLFLQKEINLYRQSALGGFLLADHQRHLGVDQRVVFQILLYSLPIFADVCLGLILVGEVDGAEIDVDLSVDTSPGTALHSLPVLK